MQVIRDLILETEIPFQRVLTFQMEWEINQHAYLYMTGIIEPEFNNRLFIGEKSIKIIYQKETLFLGNIIKTDLFYSGITTITIQAISNSYRLDQEKYSFAWQDTDKSYCEIVNKLVKKAGGSTISSIEACRIEKPVISYNETIWEFARRLASHQQTCIIADIITEKPNVWFGIRKGTKINEDSLENKITIHIVKKYKQSGTGKCKKKMYVESRQSYSLGDEARIFNVNMIVVRKDIKFVSGELQFYYELADCVELKTSYNSAFTGLCLRGTVIDSRNEELKVKFEIGEDPGDYYYPWEPETGNALYEMPENDANVLVYFPNHDEKNGIAVRCEQQGIRDWEMADKVNQQQEGSTVHLSEEQININKEKESIKVNASRSIDISGSEVEIAGSGKVSFKAKTLYLSSAHEIKATTE